MICPTCKSKLNIKIKKNELADCKCGAKLLAIEINKRLILCDVKNYEEE